MGEVGVERLIQREGRRRGVERAVRLGVVADGGVSEAGDELVDVADALDGSEFLTVATLEVS